MFAAASTDTTRLVVPFEGLVTADGWLRSIEQSLPTQHFSNSDRLHEMRLSSS